MTRAKYAIFIESLCLSGQVHQSLPLRRLRASQRNSPRPTHAGPQAEDAAAYEILIGHHYTYDHIDAPDWQILVEADFLVNLFEDGESRDAVLKIREFREIKSGTTANKYLIASGNSSGYVLNPEHTCLGERYYVDDYNGGHFPFLPKKIKYLNFAVGYARERDTALVEVAGYSFDPQMIRCESEGKPCFCFWMEAFHLGRVLQVHRKGEFEG